MLTRVFSTVLRLRVTVSYAAMLATVATTLVILGPQVQDRVIRHMSTNLHNLERGRLSTLIGSAFIAQSGPVWVWLPGLMCLLALAELLWRSRRLVVTFALGHVGATLVVAIGLATAVHTGLMPISVTRDTDVGISYGAAAVLGALTAAIPSRWRPAWIGWWVSVGILAVGMDSEFTNVGHCVALLLGILLSVRFDPSVRWTRVRVGLLIVASSFCYLVLLNTGLPLVVAPGVGLAGALVAHAVAGRWRAHRATLHPVGAAATA
jgi:hypothetical protein